MDLSVTIVGDYLSYVTLNKDYSTLKAGTVFKLPDPAYFMRKTRTLDLHESKNQQNTM